MSFFKKLGIDDRINLFLKMSCFIKKLHSYEKSNYLLTSVLLNLTLLFPFLLIFLKYNSKSFQISLFSHCIIENDI